jgi:hypothetical protein
MALVCTVAFNITELKVKYIINTLIHVNLSNNSIGGIGATSILKAFDA